MSDLAKSGWATFINDCGHAVVVPLNDLKPHDVEGDCWCKPFDDEGIIVHNSMDLREEFERGRKMS